LSDQHGVRLESPLLQREPLAGASETGLDLVDHEQRAVAPTQCLCCLQIAGRRRRHHAALDRLDDEGGNVSGTQLRLQAAEVAERNALAARQQRAETFLEELVTDEREGAERDPVKA